MMDMLFGGGGDDMVLAPGGRGGDDGVEIIAPDDDKKHGPGNGKKHVSLTIGTPGVVCFSGGGVVVWAALIWLCARGLVCPGAIVHPRAQCNAWICRGGPLLIAPGEIIVLHCR